MFLDRLRITEITGNCVMKSFDVNALYTNVSNDYAMEVTSEMFTEHMGTTNFCSFSISQLMVLLKLPLILGKYSAQSGVCQRVRNWRFLSDSLKKKSIECATRSVIEM